MPYSALRTEITAAAQAPGMTITGLATTLQVPHSSLRRFIDDGHVPADWIVRKLIAFLATLGPLTPEQANGVLRAVTAIRRELDALEALALASRQVERLEIGAVIPPADDAPPADATPSAPAPPQASAPTRRRRSAG
jgi:hypothetical protein